MGRTVMSRDQQGSPQRLIIQIEKSLPMPSLRSKLGWLLKWRLTYRGIPCTHLLGCSDDFLFLQFEKCDLRTSRNPHVSGACLVDEYLLNAERANKGWVGKLLAVKS